MKLKLYIVLLTSLLLFSCSSKKRKVTDEGILTKEAMTAILVDMHLTDATIYTYNADTKSELKLSQKCYDSTLLIKYECNDSIFRKSLEHYTLNSEIKDIYDNVLDSLNKIKVMLERGEKKNQ